MICLDEGLKLKAGKKTVSSLAFSKSGNLGFSSFDRCAYVVDLSGNVLGKACGDDYMTDSSYSSGRFGFTNYDEHVYIMDEKGKLIEKVYVGSDYADAVTMRPDGFLACLSRCAFFDFSGGKKWEMGVGHVVNGPSYYKGYWYVADTNLNEVLIVRDGRVIGGMAYSDSALDTAVCGNYLAVVTYSSLYLYDLSNPAVPKEVWKANEFSMANQVAFSPNCNHIAVVDWEGSAFDIFSIKGRLVFKERYDVSPISVGWWKNSTAIGFKDGTVGFYDVAEIRPFFPLIPANS